MIEKLEVKGAMHCVGQKDKDKKKKERDIFEREWEFAKSENRLHFCFLIQLAIS